MASNNSNKKINFKLIIIFSIIILSIILLVILIFSLLNKDNDITIDDNNSIPPSSEVVVKEETIYYLELLGDTELSLYQGDVYIDPGYIGSDNKGNDLTVNVLIVGNLDMNKIGTYKLTYTLGNVSKERIIHVVEKPIGNTTIHLNGDLTMYLSINEKYVEPGYSAVDTIDGDIPIDQIKVTSTVNTSKGGTYQVVYSVVNSSGVTTSAKRTVIVLDSEINLSASPNDYTNKDVNIKVSVNDNYFDYLLLPNGNKISEKNYTYKVSENGEYTFTVYNKRGDKKQRSIKINNIDREAPTGSCSGTYKDGTSTINISAKDNVGISRYVIDGTSYTNTKITIKKEIKTANITIYDKAGNTKDISCKLTDKNVIKYTAEYSLKNYAHSGGYTFDYWLNVPEGATSGMPLIIFLHGDGEVNRPNSIPNLAQVKYMKEKYSGSTKFIFIAPVTKETSWINGSIPTSLKGLIDKTVSDFKINTKKIYIMGFSRGAIGTWNMVNLYPTFFAAAVPMSCCAPSGNVPENFIYTKIRAISGTYDPNNEGAYNSCMTSFVNKIVAAGGNATKDTYNGHSHSTISSAINYDELFDWLLKQ